MNRTYPVEVLWCPNSAGQRGVGWGFPPAVEKRIRQDCDGHRVLHLFGGRSKFGVRLDVDQIVSPDVIGDAWLPPFAQESFDTVVLDPPYLRLNAQEKGALFRAAGLIARKRVIWFSTFWVSSGDGLSPEAAWLIRVGDNCVVRCLQYFSIKRRFPGQPFFKRGRAMKYNRWLSQPQGFPFEEVSK
jgi:hypothetical protein